MKIRIDGAKGINLESLTGKRVILTGSDIETGKFYQITVDVFDKRTAYLVMDEAERPAGRAKRKSRRTPQADDQAE
jgi:uncharacterized protein (DUF779 family)